MDRMFFLPKTETKMLTSEPIRYSVTSMAISNKWLRKALDKVFKYMIKTGYLCERPRFETQYNMERVEINLDQLDNQISHQKDIIEMVYRDRIDTLICGHDVMHKIMTGDPMKMGQVDFRFARESEFSYYNSAVGRSKVYYNNLHVILVPWFEGFLPIKRGEM